SRTGKIGATRFRVAMEANLSVAHTVPWLRVPGPRRARNCEMGGLTFRPASSLAGRARRGHYASVRAAWYERQGPAREVLQVGELPAPEPGRGEVRVQVAYSGVNAGDTKKRRGWLGSVMPFPRVIPHSDGAGVIEAVGEGADPRRVGERVWMF